MRTRRIATAASLGVLTCVATAPDLAAAQSSGDTLPSPPPIGLPIDTIPLDATPPFPAGVRIAGQEYGTPVGIEWVAVNRETMEIRFKNFGTNADVANLVKQVDNYSDDWLQIIASPGGFGTAAFDPGHVIFNRDVVAKLGGKPLDARLLNDSEPFSVIGAKDWDAGTAQENIGGRATRQEGFVRSPTDGSLTGYLQRNPATRALGFAFGDYIPFDTKARQEGGTNVISIGGKEYPSPQGRPGLTGFEFLYLDPATLTAEVRVLAETNNPNWDRANAEAHQLAAGLDLQEAAEDNYLVVVQSIGTPHPTTVGWNQIAKGIGMLGGTPAIINGLDGKSGYALIGGAPLKDKTIESVDDPGSLQTGSLSGLLARRRDAIFEPILADPAGRQDGDQLLQIAYQPASAWPVRDTDGQRAAMAFIADKLGLRGGDPRYSYRELDVHFDSATYTGALNALQYPGSDLFTAGDFDMAKAELLSEFLWVTKVRSYTEQLRTVLTESVILNGDELRTIATKIKDRAHVEDRKATMNAYQIYSELFAIAGKFGVEGAGPIGGVFKLAGALTKSKGRDVLGEFNGTAEQLAEQLVKGYGDALTSLGLLSDVIVTDHDKLRTVGENIIAKKAGWHWTHDTIAETRNGLAIAARRSFAQSLLRVVYHGWALPRNFQDAPSCRVLAHEPASAWMSRTDSFSQSGADVRRDATAVAIGTDENDTSGGMRADFHMTDDLFVPLSRDHPDRLGLYKPAFIGNVLPQAQLTNHHCQSLSGR